jgi:hypothetical protein
MIAAIMDVQPHDQRRPAGKIAVSGRSVIAGHNIPPANGDHSRPSHDRWEGMAAHPFGFRDLAPFRMIAVGPFRETSRGVVRVRSSDHAGASTVDVCARAKGSPDAELAQRWPR